MKSLFRYTFVLFLNQVTNDFVVEIGNIFPGDSFFFVLFLLRLEGQLYEQLLQLLVAEINAELLEAGSKGRA